MKTIICGGRNYRLTTLDFMRLNEIHARTAITEVVSGRARGADLDGEKWAAGRGISVTPFPITEEEWHRFGLSAGPRRNQRMADYAEAVIAFPGDRGTRDMLNRAAQANLVILYNANT